ncbi:MAG: protein kinase [Planctomycetes bacterium]|nr:protein kinase [Planctomycetota bacterium]
MREEDVEFGRVVLEKGLLSQKDLDSVVSELLGPGGAELPAVLQKRGLLTEEQVKEVVDELRRLSRLRKAKEILQKLKGGTGVPPEVTKAMQQPGLHMGKYVRVEEIGKGSLGSVWKTWDCEEQKWKALKLLTSFRRGNVKEVLEDALSAGRVVHSGVVHCYETGMTEGSISIPFIVLDYVEGRNLENLRRAGLTAEKAAKILRDAARAIHDAHQAGVLHLDIKPRNILIDANGEVHVTDFGQAPPIGSVDIEATTLLPKAGEVRGTPGYLAPEQALGRKHDITVRTDVYGLGATLYFILTGKPPFEADTPLNCCLKTVHEEPPKPTELDPSIPGDLERIVFRAMAKDPVRRYEHPRQMVDDLDRVIEGKPIQSDDEMKFAQGLAALHAGRIEESITMFKDLIRQGAQAGADPSKRDGVLQRLDEGEAGLSLAIEQQRKNYDVRTQRGVLRLAKAIILSLDGKDPGEACKGSLDDFTKANALRPEHSTARLNSANILIFSARYARALGKSPLDLFQMALNELNEACRLDMTNVAALHNRGTVYFYVAREAKRAGADADDFYLRAIDDFTAALTLEPGNAYVLKDLGVIKVALAKLRLAQGKKVKDLYEQALDSLTRATRLNAGLYGAWFERGHAHFALKAFNHAIQDWERALELDPSRADAIRPLLEEARAWAVKRGTHPPQEL